MMENSLQQTQKQQQRFSQWQIQQIKLLEVPSIELEARILAELSENPALELLEDGPEPEKDGEEVNTYNEDPEGENLGPDNDNSEGDEEGADSDDSSDATEELTSDGGLSDDSYNAEDDFDDRGADYGETMPRDPNAGTDRPEPFTTHNTDSLQDFLIRQLGELDLTADEEMMARYIIGSIDDDGYLRCSLSSIADQLSFQRSMDVEEEQLEAVLERIQDLEPAGVAARDLQQCLLLQLRRKESYPNADKAVYLLEHYFDDFSHGRYDKICQDWGVTDEEFAAARKLIAHLNPKPGNDWENSLLNETGRAILPDFIVENHDGKLVVTLNETALPRLGVSACYIDLAHQTPVQGKKKATPGQREAIAFARQKADAAEWFIHALEQRRDTLLKTMNAIVSCQRDFFLTGEEKRLKPLKLKDVASMVDMDISTISRVNSSKFVQTEFGTFPLKFFYSEAMQNEQGEEVSVREIKTILKEIVASEDAHRPYTDDVLVTKLKEKGYPVARRTVAKYREQLNIPSSRQRQA